MKYTVHRALAMLKTTKARIARELAEDNMPWVRVARGQEETISGVAIKDIESDIQGRYDRVVALIDNYRKIKAAVVKSNAGVSAEAELYRARVGGGDYTVAEIIELMDTIYGREKKPGFKAMLLAKMKKDYVAAQHDFDDMQEQADEEVRQYISTLTGRKQDEEKNSTSKAVVEATSKMLHEQKDPKLIDPLHIANKIKALEQEIEDFRTNADAVLSEQNALRTIEVDLTAVE